MPKWNTLNLKQSNQIEEADDNLRDPIKNINKLEHQIHRKDRYGKHINGYDNPGFLQDHSNPFIDNHYDEVDGYDEYKEHASSHRKQYSYDEKYENVPITKNAHEERRPKYLTYDHSHVDRSGEFVASPVDPGMSYPGEDKQPNFNLTPHQTQSSYQPVYFNGAYRGQYVDKAPKNRRKNRRASFKSIIRNSALGRGVNKIKTRIQRGGKRVFFRNNQGGLSGSSFNSPSFGMLKFDKYSIIVPFYFPWG